MITDDTLLAGAAAPRCGGERTLSEGVSRRETLWPDEPWLHENPGELLRSLFARCVPLAGITLPALAKIHLGQTARNFLRIILSACTEVT